MKKLIFLASMVAALFLAGSCQRENLEPVQQGGTVTYTVQVPDALATKAAGDYELIYEVYRQAQVGTGADPIYEGKQTFSGNSVNLPLEFVKDQNFVVLFWAQKEGVTAYDIADLRKVSISTASKLTANNDDYEVFAGNDTVINCQSQKNGEVSLVRPVAQINIATTKAGLILAPAGPVLPEKHVEVANSDVKVYGLWRSFNVATNNVNGETAAGDADLAFGRTLSPKSPFGNDHLLVAKSYVGFIPQNGATVKVDFNLETSNDGTIYHEVSNVPVKPNYKTNIIGNLISATDNYQVTIDQNWADAGKDMEVLADGIVENINGDYEISTAVGFAYAINKLFADGGTFYIHPGRYDFNGLVVVPQPTNTGAILNVKANEKPVVTRSAPVFEITGLDVDYLVSKVTAGSQAIFSNLVLPADTKLVGTNDGVVGVSGCSNEDTNKPDELVGSGDGEVVNTVSMRTVAEINAAIAKGLKLIELTGDLTGLTEIFTINSPVTIDGCGHKLTSTAPRAINVDGVNANGVTIKNLTIEATGERAINVINNATNVTIDNVAATSANYTVNVAATAPDAKIKIENSTLNGLNTVNVAAPNVKVTVNNSTVNCNDNNTTAGEAYSALCLNKAAVGAEIIATNTVVNVTEDSDSSKGRNGAEDGTVTINGSTEGVTITVAVITYPESDYYYGFETVASAMEFAKEGDVISLIRDITLEEPIIVAEDKTVALNLNGKTINTVFAEGSTTNHIYAFTNNGTLTLKNGTINARGIFNYGTMTLESGTINAIDGNGGYGVRNYPGAEFIMNGGTIATTLEDDNKVNNGGYDATTLRVDEGASAIINGGNINNICDYTFALDNYGTVTVNGGTFQSIHSTVSTYGTMTIIDGSFACNGIEGITAHCLVAWEDSETTIKGGTFDGKDNYNGFNVDACKGSVVNIEGGKFLSVHSGSLYGEGTISVKGGTFFDKVPAERLERGYKVVENPDGTYTVEEMTPIAQIGNVLYESLQEAIDEVNEGETILLCNDVTIATPAYGQNALNYSGAANFTIDLNNKSIYADTGNSVFRFNISGSGATSDVTLTLKNGTVTAGDNTWCAVMASGISTDAKAVFNLENLTINASKANDSAVKAWGNSLINATNVTVNATKCAGGFYAAGGEIVLTNCTVNQKGLYTAPYMSMALSVASKGKMTVNSGAYATEPTAASEGANQGTTHGSWCAGVMNSGGELIINGGTFANGNYGDDALATYARGLIFGDTASKIVINDGTFNALKSIIDYQNNLGVQPNPNIVINGGNFSADPSVVTSYGGVIIKEGFTTIKGADGRWTLVKAQPNTEIWYTGDMKLEPTNPDALNANILSNVWDASIGKYVMTFDAPLTTIGNEAFKRINNTTPSNWMTSISLPNNVKTIGNYAFAQCYSLTEITIPDSVETIGEYAFRSCNAATKVTIGSGVETIASGAFYNCYEIKEITCKSTTPPVVADKWVFNGAEITKVVVPAASVDAYKAADVWKNFNIVAE